FFQAEDGIRDFHVTGVQTCALPISTTSQAQPEPNRVPAALANCSLNASKPPKVESMAPAKSPLGEPPPSGLSTSQKRLWLRKPPPLFCTAVRMSCGTLARSLTSSSALFEASSGCFSMAALRLLVY